MREQVAIVLNEREPLKQKMAERLERRFKELGITSFRYQVDAGLVQRLADRKPPVIILDYLLGDHATGLDILSAFSPIDPAFRSACYFFTDEPSISVAVEAMRLGAQDFFQLDQLDSFEQLISSIRKTLLTPRSGGAAPLRPLLQDLDDLIALSPKMQALMQRVRLLEKLPPPALLLSGGPGSGRSTLAHLTGKAVLGEHLSVLIDYRFFGGSELELKNMLQAPSLERSGPNNLHLIVDHVDESPGPVLACVEWLSRHAAPQPAERPRLLLSVITSRSEIVTAWNSYGLGAHMPIPSLEDRREDLPLLTQAFISECVSALGIRRKVADAEISKWALARRWPHSLTQLRAVLFEALAGDESSPLLDRLSRAAVYWEESATVQPEEQVRSRVAALAALEASDFDFRCAAALLGWSVRGLREVVAEKVTTHEMTR